MARTSVMGFNLTKAKILFNSRFLIAFFLLTWLCFEAHEFVHYIAIFVQGGKFYAAFNRWWIVTGSLTDAQSAVATAAGPLMTYALAWLGMLILLRSKSGRLLIYFTKVALQTSRHDG